MPKMRMTGPAAADAVIGFKRIVRENRIPGEDLKAPLLILFAEDESSASNLAFGLHWSEAPKATIKLETGILEVNFPFHARPIADAA